MPKKRFLDIFRRKKPEKSVAKEEPRRVSLKPRAFNPTPTIAKELTGAFTKILSEYERTSDNTHLESAWQLWRASRDSYRTVKQAHLFSVAGKPVPDAVPALVAFAAFKLGKTEEGRRLAAEFLEQKPPARMLEAMKKLFEKHGLLKELKELQILRYVGLEAKLAGNAKRVLVELRNLRKSKYVQFPHLHLSPEIAESYFRMFQRTFSDTALQAAFPGPELRALQAELAHGLATFSVNGNTKARDLILQLHPMISIGQRAKMTDAQRKGIVTKYPSLAISEISNWFTLGVRNFGKKNPVCK